MLVDEVLSIKEAAKMLRISPETLYSWLWKRKLRRIKCGRHTLVAKSDLENMLKTQEKTQQSP